MYIVIFALLAAGMFTMAQQVLRLPPASTAKGVRLASQKGFTLNDLLYRLYIKPVARLIAPYIRMADFKEKRMQVQLARAGIPLSPKEYLARSVLMAATAMIMSGIFISFAVKNMLPVSVILGVIVFFHFHGEVKDKLKDKDKMIEAELPKFIRAIVQGMKTEKDIIKLLETYETIAGKGLKYDIEVLIMDLKSGNFEEGMMDFDKRVGNAYISRLSKALISANRGDNQDSALNYLMSDMGLLAKETMQRELNKRPGRVKALSIPVVIVAVAALFYVIGVNLFNSLGGIM